MASETNTQKIVDIQNIRNDVVIAKGGKMRAILLVGSINLALKSQDEQESIILGYQDFLNSLDFPVQILVNSRFINIGGYLENIKKMVPNQKTELLKMQTQEYTKFIEKFVEGANIVSTNFYIVIPFSLLETTAREGGAMERLKSLFGAKTDIESVEQEKFMYFKGQLMQRVDFVSSGLHRVGLTTKMLSTKELISLFWSMYNPGDLTEKTLINSMFY